jgi:hypothetical protein
MTLATPGGPELGGSLGVEAGAVSSLASTPSCGLLASAAVKGSAPLVEELVIDRLPVFDSGLATRLQFRVRVGPKR